MRGILRKPLALLVGALLLAIVTVPRVLYGGDKTHKLSIIYTGTVLAEIEPCG